MNVVTLIIDWLTRARDTLDLGSQVRVKETGERTVVRIDHRIPAVDAARSGWRVTTRKQFLPRAHFPADVRSEVNRASLERGRRIFCIDMASNEVIAAIAYHVDADKRMPVFITAIALRTDAGAPAELYDESRGAAFLLKQYVHEIARQTGRGGHVDIDADGVETLRDLANLGFKRAPKIKGLRVSGRHLRQLPLP